MTDFEHACDRLREAPAWKARLLCGLAALTVFVLMINIIIWLIFYANMPFFVTMNILLIIAVPGILSCAVLAVKAEG